MAEQLRDTQLGILCLTPQNLHSRWIHFEAGAISKAVEASLVCNYLLDVDVSALEPPLSQFQATKADRPGTHRLVQTINAALGGAGFTADRLPRIFDVWWRELEPNLVTLPTEDDESRVPPRSEAEILEELVNLVRSQKNATPDRTVLSAIRDFTERIDLVLKEFGVRMPFPRRRDMGAARLAVDQLGPYRARLERKLVGMKERGDARRIDELEQLINELNRLDDELASLPDIHIPDYELAPKYSDVADQVQVFRKKADALLMEYVNDPELSAEAERLSRSGSPPHKAEDRYPQRQNES
jgi:hypothetical protein